MNGSSLSGTFDAAALNTSGDAVSSGHATVTGTVSGQNIALTLSVGPSWLGGQTTVSGTVEGSDLVLNYTAGDGSLASMTFSPADVAPTTRPSAGSRPRRPAPRSARAPPPSRASLTPASQPPPAGCRRTRINSRATSQA